MRRKDYQVNGTAMPDGSMALECDQCGPIGTVPAGPEINPRAHAEGRAHMNEHGVEDDDIAIKEGS